MPRGVTRFLRYLLNYTFLLALTAAVTVGYLYRNELYPALKQGTGLLRDEMRKGLASLDEGAGQVVSPVVANENGVANRPINPGVGSGNALSSQEETAIEAAATLMPPMLEAVAEPAEVAQQVSTAVGDEALPPVAGQQGLAEGEGHSPSVSATEPSAGDVHADAEASLPERLALARAAYWRGELQLAEAQYAGLLEAWPENPNIAGELGNLYYAQGRYAEAAEYYHQAGLTLLDAGYIGQAMQLLRILYGLSPERAVEFEKRLEERLSQE